MATGIQQELSDFHQFIGEKLASGAAGLSPEEALDLWRAEHPSEEEFAETVAALREAIADMEAGDKGIPIEEFDRELRQRYPDVFET